MIFCLIFGYFERMRLIIYLRIRRVKIRHMTKISINLVELWEVYN